MAEQLQIRPDTFRHNHNWQLKCAPVPPRPKLKFFLENLGMTVAELAEKSGVAYNTVLSLTDENRDGFRLSVLRKIATALGCDPADLIDVGRKSFILGSGNKHLDESILDFLVIQRRSSRPEATSDEVNQVLSYLSPNFRFCSPHHKNWSHRSDDAPLSDDFIEKLSVGMNAQEWLRFNQYNKSQAKPAATYVSQPRYFLPTGIRAFSIHGTTMRLSPETMESGVANNPLSYCSHCKITEPWDEVGPGNPLRFDSITYLAFSNDVGSGGQID